MGEAATGFMSAAPAAFKLDVRMISLDLLDEPFLPQRSKFNDEEFAALVESIAHNGVEVPLKVRPVGERFQIIAGHRRFTAARVAGLRDVPCMIESCTDLEALRKMIAENTGREEPSDAEQGRHYLEICERFSLDEVAVAKMVGKSESYVSERCRLVRRFPEIAAANEEGLLKWCTADQLSRVNEYTYAATLRMDVATIPEEKREQITRHRAMLLDLCVQQGATLRLATSYVDQWKRSIIPMNSYDPSLAAQATAPQSAMPSNRCACCGGDSDQNALVPLYVHSWEKAALKNALRAAGMFGYE
jgi:ParB/RepB/Spo0J family partition protein